MLDIVALVLGVPLVLMALLLALGRFEASVTPDHPGDARDARALEPVERGGGEVESVGRPDEPPQRSSPQAA